MESNANVNDEKNNGNNSMQNTGKNVCCEGCERQGYVVHNRSVDGEPGDGERSDGSIPARTRMQKERKYKSERTGAIRVVY